MGRFSEYEGKAVDEILAKEKRATERIELLENIIYGYVDYIKNHDFEHDFIENPNYARKLLNELKTKE